MDVSLNFDIKLPAELLEACEHNPFLLPYALYIRRYDSYLVQCYLDIDSDICQKSIRMFD